MNDWQTELRRRYPPPATEGIEPYYFSLDGGGRDLVADAIRQFDVRVMLEIGCFLCGSTTQWLEASERLTVVGVDPWKGDFSRFLEGYKDNPVFASCFSKITDREAFITSVRTHGPAVSAAANVRRFGERFFPVKASSPAVLPELAALGLQPQMVYFDSTKVLDDLLVCHELFPYAVLCGDDWTWGADQGYPVRVVVGEFCSRFGRAVTAKRATWLISRAAAG